MKKGLIALIVAIALAITNAPNIDVAHCEDCDFGLYEITIDDPIQDRLRFNIRFPVIVKQIKTNIPEGSKFEIIVTVFDKQIGDNENQLPGSYGKIKETLIAKNEEMVLSKGLWGVGTLHFKKGKMYGGRYVRICFVEISYNGKKCEVARSRKEYDMGNAGAFFKDFSILNQQEEYVETKVEFEIVPNVNIKNLRCWLTAVLSAEKLTEPVAVFKTNCPEPELFKFKEGPQQHIIKLEFGFPKGYVKKNIRIYGFVWDDSIKGIVYSDFFSTIIDVPEK